MPNFYYRQTAGSNNQQFFHVLFTFLYITFYSYNGAHLCYANTLKYVVILSERKTKHYATATAFCTSIYYAVHYARGCLHVKAFYRIIAPLKKEDSSRTGSRVVASFTVMRKPPLPFLPTCFDRMLKVNIFFINVIYC
ncbi:hypothetical protein FC093_22440 [Ilyomonas limi]|uniref:Uncharacterized protein n=1 Tax=Ilyomonas limi TaxID=2575867 RepID=A0A4U3KQG4_9BACT|nr:hypothetical protein [Ilyomonas limi]TKK64470.1 hypothetical protein FC093_22440 [Ilyomonas limi]